MKLTAGEIATAVDGRLGGDRDRVVTSWHTDSRLVEPGGAFIALRGAEADGHAFLRAAIDAGAGLVLVERGRGGGVAASSGVVVIEVDDTWEALYAAARSVLERVRPVVVGITGSNGKTSTKELCAAALSVRHRVHRTAGNLNTETGLPLTLLALEPEHEVAVLEMGMQGPGEIARLAALAGPSIGVITSIGTVHAAYFPDGIQGIARAKAELVEALPPDGLAVINGDDDFFPLLSSWSAAPVTSFGLGGGDVRADGYRQLPDGGSTFLVQALRMRLRMEGRHQARNAVAALVVARRLGVGFAEAAEAIAEVDTPNRLARRVVADGWTLVDDAYNASPESMRAAFDTVRGMARARGGRRLAVLGEMRELGDGAEAAHRIVGEEASHLFDRIAVVDVGFGSVLAAAAGADLVPDRDAALAWLREHARAGDVVLVKASHGVALDKLTAELPS